MEKLTHEQVALISSLIKLLNRGIKEVNVELYASVLFSSGFNVGIYNEVVPTLVKCGLIKSSFDAPRDGPIISLTSKAIEQFS
ncbi:hypothetical protein [Thalassotalea litorea]|uniref:hypothetical protein n=1 Tax=Thalassotalea litorea TaxID=2020715 RepID=UPI003735C22A